MHDDIMCTLLLALYIVVNTSIYVHTCVGVLYIEEYACATRWALNYLVCS